MPQTTAPPSADLPEITVIGHRREAGSLQPFPSITLSDITPPQYSEIEPVIEGPCDDPATREEIDADAAAAAFLKKVFEEITRAGESFATREYGALLVRQADGSIKFMKFAAGPGAGYGPPVDLSGINPANVVGYVHTHPSPGSISAPDWSDVYNYLYQQGSQANGDMRNLRMYLGSQTSEYLSTKTYLHVWKGGNWGATEPVVEVNQEATPCSAN